jgi:L-aminopeptidase/D-esterase-like protein
MRNLLTDVAGIKVGSTQDEKLASGVTAMLFDEPSVASVSVSGGAPAGRDLHGLEPDARIDRVDAILLSGGSAFGLDAASGAQAWLRERGRGVAIGGVCVPIVPQAICFDLLNGGDKDWGRYPPYRELGYAAAAAAAASADFALGSVGAGTGATTVNCKGGLGSASAVTAEGHVIGALAAVNAVGSVTIGDGPWFWAAPFERAGEFGGLGWPTSFSEQALKPVTKGSANQSTTLVVVATDAILNKMQAKRLAVMAQSGLSRAIYPVHTPLDGDVVFAASTGRKPLADPLIGLVELGTVAANVVARAIARGVFAAAALPLPGALPAWADRFKR